MQVFKAYGRILQKNSLGILIYIGIFLFIAIMIGGSLETSDFSFESKKYPISIINRGEETNLITDFTEFLKDYAIIEPMEDDMELIQDALFERAIQYFIIIPEDFSLTNGKELEVMGIENSPITFQMNMIVDKYFNAVNLFVASGLAPELVGKEVSVVFENTVDVSIQTNTATNIQTFILYFNYLPYVLLGATITGISVVMSTFHNKNIHRRNSCAPIKLTSINLQIILGNLCLGLLIWFAMTGAGLILNWGKFTINSQFITVIINTFILSIVSISIAFLIGNLVSSRDAQSGICNIISLGFCFLGGVFVPQELLGDTVNNIAMFIPTHWYMKINNLIVEGASLLNSSEILVAMGIQILFAVTFFIIAVAVSKAKRQSRY